MDINNYNKGEVINDLCLRIANLTLQLSIKDTIIEEQKRNINLYQQRLNNYDNNNINNGGIINE